MERIAVSGVAEQNPPRRMEWLFAVLAVVLVVAAYANILVLALGAGLVVLALALVRFQPLLLALVFFLPVAPYLSWDLPVKDLGTLLRVCLFAGALASRVHRGESIRAWLFSGKLTWTMLVYCLVAVLSGVAFNPFTPSVARELMRLASYVCFYYVITDWVRTDEDFTALLKALMISCLCVVAFGFYQIVVGDYSALFEALYPIQDELLKNPPWSGRITSFLSHFNGLAGYLNLVIPFCIGFGIHARDVLLRRLSRVCFVLSSIALVLTQSRGGLLTYGAILLMSALFLAPSARRKLQWSAAIVVGAVAMGIVAGLVFERLAGVDQFTELTRLAIWAGAFSVFAGSPVMGIGYGNLRQQLGGVVGGPDGWMPDAHNLYLQLLAETGIIGLMAFAAVVVVALAIALRLRRKPRFSIEWVIGFAAFAGIAGVMVHGCVDYMFHTTPQFAATFFLVLGLLNAVSRRQERTKPEPA